MVSTTNTWIVLSYVVLYTLLLASVEKFPVNIGNDTHSQSCPVNLLRQVLCVIC